MFERTTISKVRQFCAAASSGFTQKDAKRIWNDDLWKMNLKAGEIMSIYDAWAGFVVTGNPTELDTICDNVVIRLNSK